MVLVLTYDHDDRYKVQKGDNSNGYADDNGFTTDDIRRQGSSQTEKTARERPTPEPPELAPNLTHSLSRSAVVDLGTAAEVREPTVSVSTLCLST